MKKNVFFQVPKKVVCSITFGRGRRQGAGSPKLSNLAKFESGSSHALLPLWGGGES